MIQCSHFAFITVQAGNEYSVSVIFVASVAMTVAVTGVTVIHK